MSLHYLRDPSLPPSVYEGTVTRCDYPALTGELSCDVCVVGGGMAGLHTALSLVESGAHVILLEARRIGWGASGRNGGHAIPEFACGMARLESAMGEDDAGRAWQIVRAAGQDLRRRISQHGIDCEYQSGHIEAAIGTRHVESLLAWQRHAQARYGAKFRLIQSEEMHKFVGSDRYQAALYDQEGGHLHPLKLTLGLAKAVATCGGQVFEHSAVTGWQTDGTSVTVSTEQGAVRARQLVLCANVGIAEVRTRLALSMTRRILPVGTWIIATEPLSAEIAQSLIPSRAAVCDNRVVLDYFRLDARHRMIFGGGCSYTGAATPQGFAKSIRLAMIKVFPQLASAHIEYAWGGVIDISQLRMPDLGCDESGRVFFAQGFSGSGIVSTLAVAGILHRAINGNDADLRRFMRVRQKNFPGGEHLRGLITAAGMFWHRLQDHL